MKRPSYFSLYEIALLSLFGALVFVLRTAIIVPIHVPGSSGIFWVLPLIVGTAIVRKPGAGTYAGLVSGILASFFGIEPLHVFDVFKYTAMGITIDLVSMAFGYRLENPVVGFVAGAAGNVVKMVVNYAVHLLLGVQGVFILRHRVIVGHAYRLRGHRRHHRRPDRRAALPGGYRASGRCAG